MYETIIIGTLLKYSYLWIYSAECIWRKKNINYCGIESNFGTSVGVNENVSCIVDISFIDIDNESGIDNGSEIHVDSNIDCCG